MSKKLTDAEKAVRKAQRQLDAARAEVAAAKIARVDLLPNNDGAVIKFNGKFPGMPATYNYAAIRGRGRWFTTGATCPRNGFSPRELIARLDEMNATEFTVLIGVETVPLSI